MAKRVLSLVVISLILGACGQEWNLKAAINYIVADRSGLFKILSDGSRIEIITGTGGRGPAVDKAGNFYLIARGIVRITPSGSVSQIFSGSPLIQPVAIALDLAGNVLVGDNVTDSIFRITPDGKSITEIAKLPSSPEMQDIQIVVEASGDCVVSGDENDSGKLYRIAKDGSITTIPMAPGVRRIGGLAIDSSGNFIIAEFHQSAILRVGHSGVVQTVASGSALCCNLTGLAIDPSTGNFIATLNHANKVVRITPAGNISTVVSGPPLTYPQGIAITGFTTPALIIAPASGPAGTTFNFQGTGFTPGGTATQFISWPDGSVHLGLVVSKLDGSLSWSYKSRCADQTGVYTIWVRDDATGLTSNQVREEIIMSSQCADIPGTPQFLGQRDSKGDIQFGDSTTDTTVTLKGALGFLYSGLKVKLQVELRRLDEFEGKFLYQATQESQLVDLGLVSVTVYGLVPGRYHWQARAVDEEGRKSAWIQAGNNLVSSPDFVVVDIPTGPNIPWLNAAGVVNGASFKTEAVAPGTLISLFGAQLSRATEQSTRFPLPTELGGTSVTFNGIPAPLLFVSPTQINLQVPYEISGPTVSIVVKAPAGNSRSLVLSLVSTSPGMFTRSQTGKGEVTVVHADFRLVTANDPATPGEGVSIFATGLGRVEPQIASGHPAGTDRLYQTVVQPIVLVDGIRANISFSGLAPGFVGLYQVNFEAPPAAARGTAVSVMLSADSRNGNLVTMPTSSGDSIPADIRPVLEKIASQIDIPPVQFWFQIHGLGPVFDLFGFVFRIYKIYEFSKEWPDPQFRANLIDSIYNIGSNQNTRNSIDGAAWQGCARPRWSDLSPTEKLDQGCQFEVLIAIGGGHESGILFPTFAKRLLQ